MIILIKDVNEWSKEADDIRQLLDDNKIKYDYYSDDVLVTSCPKCGDSEFWSIYDKECRHCGYSM